MSSRSSNSTDSAVKKAEADVKKAEAALEKAKATLEKAKADVKQITSIATISQSKCHKYDIRKLLPQLGLTCDGYKQNEAKVLFLKEAVLKKYNTETSMSYNQTTKDNQLQLAKQHVVRYSRAKTGDILFFGQSPYGDFEFYIKTDKGAIGIVGMTDDRIKTQQKTAFNKSADKAIDFAKENNPTIDYTMAHEILMKLMKK